MQLIASDKQRRTVTVEFSREELATIAGILQETLTGALQPSAKEWDAAMLGISKSDALTSLYRPLMATLTETADQK